MLSRRKLFFFFPRMLIVRLCFLKRIDWRCAGTCLQGKRSKFQSEGMRTGLEPHRDTSAHPSVPPHAMALCLGGVFFIEDRVEVLQ